MRLHTFFWLATALAVAFSAINWLGLAGWLATLVVFGSGCYAHCRKCNRYPHARGHRIMHLSRTYKRTSVTDVPAPPPSHLERHSRVGWLLPISVSIGGLIGGISGAIALSILTSSSSFAGALARGLSSGCAWRRLRISDCKLC